MDWDLIGNIVVAGLILGVINLVFKITVWFISLFFKD